MKLKLFNHVAGILLFLILSRQAAVADATITQSLTLKPGWNSVFLGVQPEQSTPAQVFSQLPADSSVWVWINKNSSVEFISNPNEALVKTPGWCVYFNDPEKAFLNNLYAIISGWSYLINVSGDQNLTISVSGVPSVKKTAWITDSFNLTGFHVDPDNPPDFESYFSESNAHAGQAIYTLNNGTGKWDYVNDPANTKIIAGQAYWVYCDGASQYQGPLEIILPGVNGLDFGKFTETLTLTMLNTSNSAQTLSLSILSTNINLAYRVFNQNTGRFEWPPLSSMPAFSLNPIGKNILIAVQRDTLETEREASFIQIRSTIGTQLIVPVVVEKEITR